MAHARKTFSALLSVLAVLLHGALVVSYVVASQNRHADDGLAAALTVLCHGVPVSVAQKEGQQAPDDGPAGGDRSPCPMCSVASLSALSGHGSGAIALPTGRASAVLVPSECERTVEAGLRPPPRGPPIAA